MKKYLYKNIRCIRVTCGWNANYILDSGKVFGLHVCGCRTKKRAYEIAKEQVDYMNELEKEKPLEKIYSI